MIPVNMTLLKKGYVKERLWRRWEVLNIGRKHVKERLRRRWGVLNIGRRYKG